MTQSIVELPEVSLFIRFYGESFDHVEITRRLGIEPYEAWRTGDEKSFQGGKRYRRHDGWMIKVGPCRTVAIDGLLRELRERFDVESAATKKLCADLDIEAVIVCGVIQNSEGPSAAIEFPGHFLAWAAEHGASIIVDVIGGVFAEKM